MPYIQCSTISMYYEEEGSGRTLLLLSGLGCDCRVWAGVRQRLSRDYRVIMPDPRGMGRSEYDGQSFTVWQVAADIAEFAGKLGLSDMLVCGHSMGGQVALQMALDFRELISGLVLVCTDSYLGAEVVPLLRGWTQTRCSDGDMDKWLREVYKWMVTDEYYCSHQLESAVKYGLNLPVYKSDDDFRRQFQAIEDVDLRERLEAITLPVMIIAGKKDRIFPLDRQYQLSRMLRNSTLIVLDNCAHSPLMEASGEFIRLLRRAGEN